MRYFIVAYPKMYNMQYGICDYRIVEGTYDEMCSIGARLSREVIEEFCHPEEEWYSHEDSARDNQLEKWDDEYIEDYNAILESIIESEIAYNIWQVKPETTEEAIRLWSNADDNVKEFIERYCEIEGE